MGGLQVARRHGDGHIPIVTANANAAVGGTSRPNASDLGITGLADVVGRRLRAILLHCLDLLNCLASEHAACPRNNGRVVGGGWLRRRSTLPASLSQTVEHVFVVLRAQPGHAHSGAGVVILGGH